MDMQLKGKRALVTGSTAGIGLATAMGLAREGAVVIVNGRTQERVTRAVSEICRAYPQAEVTGVPADLSTRRRMRAGHGPRPRSRGPREQPGRF